MNNDEKCGSLLLYQVRDRFDWRRALGDSPVGTKDGIKRPNDRKRLWKVCGLIYTTVMKEYSQRSMIDRSRSAIEVLDHQGTLRSGMGRSTTEYLL